VAGACSAHRTWSSAGSSGRPRLPAGRGPAGSLSRRLIRRAEFTERMRALRFRRRRLRASVSNVVGVLFSRRSKMGIRPGHVRSGKAGLSAFTLLVGAVGAIAAVGGAAPPAAGADPSGCQMGHGVKHVGEIVFDNVHFFRDTPNVPSDLEQMPHLLNFLESNGTVFSNTHTPLIAPTADDSLTVYTGLYGDRHA